MSDDDSTDRVCADGIGLKNDIDIQWKCTTTHLIFVSPSLPPAMHRPEARWCMETFELEEALYKGAASLVYVAVDRLTSKTVVLKLYRKSKLSILNRFQVEREIHLHGRLQHDHIIDLFAAFEDSKYVYLVQEYAEKGDLFVAMKEDETKMTEKEIVQRILHPFLTALQYLHGKGIIHRDIKPENIFMTGDGKIKVADFGLSIDVGKERPVTRAGTLDYMAPEVLNCPNKVLPEDNKSNKSLAYNSRVDVWATGILAYELVTGSPPFENESRSMTYEAIMCRNPEFPENMSFDCQSFIKKALTKNSKARPTIDALLEHSWITGYTEAAIEQLQTPLRQSVDPLTPEDGRNEQLSFGKTSEASIDSRKEHQAPSAAEFDRHTFSSPAATADLCTAVSSQPDPGSIDQPGSCPDGYALEKIFPGAARVKKRSSKQVLFSLETVERTPSLPRIRAAKKEGSTGLVDDLQLRSSKQSLNLVHSVFSKKEEEGRSPSEKEEILRRLPSYSFFPTDKKKIFHPAHRLNRELTGSQNSFTEKVISGKTDPTKASPRVQFKSQETSPEVPKKDRNGRRLSFRPFWKKK